MFGRPSVGARATSYVDARQVYVSIWTHKIHLCLQAMARAFTHSVGVRSNRAEPNRTDFAIGRLLMAAKVAKLLGGDGSYCLPVQSSLSAICRLTSRRFDLPSVWMGREKLNYRRGGRHRLDAMTIVAIISIIIADDCDIISSLMCQHIQTA